MKTPVRNLPQQRNRFQPTYFPGESGVFMDDGIPASPASMRETGMPTGQDTCTIQ
ncbi:MAG: hypothetical protein KAH38_12690 [Candidatus Hydrogenedentes bacterium]|nr:hypothetical protein [Candidatus Hydrogenedentota bacterium]